MENTHQHGPECGHKKIPHGNHVDYLKEDGTLECVEGTHSVAVSEKNPNVCKPINDSVHIHGPTCGHQKVMHGDHVDYLVDGTLEHPHGSHNDNHGKLT